MPERPINSLPLVHELHPAPTPTGAFRKVAHRQRCIFFDSAQRLPALGRYSFLAVDPFDWIAVDADAGDGLATLADKLTHFDAERVPELPPFQGGAAGLLGYEIARSLERLPKPRYDEFKTPALAAGLYDVVIAWDHEQDRCWVVSQGFPELEPAARRQRAEQRLSEMLGWLNSPEASASPDWRPRQWLDASRLAPQFPTAVDDAITSDFSREAYLAAVARAVEYIHAGDVFQVNLSQRLLMRQQQSPVDVYLALRERNAAPFGGYFDLGATQVASASPERFLSVCDRSVETRPIKGTRRRSTDAEQDRQLAAELLAHEKDHAENVMIVDLMRNDLSRVCTPESVCVPELCRLESYQHVHHLVSVVTGELAADRGPIDLLRVALPGGSITGAPKVRAMEIIAELEPTARGPYCGSLFYLGFNGEMDSSILIRTLVASGGWLQASVGGGIVADSDPRAEYEETWHKAAGLLL